MWQSRERLHWRRRPLAQSCLSLSFDDPQRQTDLTIYNVRRFTKRSSLKLLRSHTLVVWLLLDIVAIAAEETQVFCFRWIDG